MRPSYSYLQYIVEDNGRGERFALVFGFVVVVIKGKNLQGIVDAISSENCEFIEEFDPLRYLMPRKDQAKIDSVEYHLDREKREMVLAEMESRA
jgi:hypothetical protein